MHNYDGHKFVHTDEMELIVDKLMKLLPAVPWKLKEIGRLEEWVSFFTLVNEGDFNLDNIATKLFLYVVKFTDSRNIHAMGFTDDVKNLLDNRISIIR